MGFIPFRRAQVWNISQPVQEGFAVPVSVFQKDEDLFMDQMESPAFSQCVALLTLGWT